MLSQGGDYYKLPTPMGSHLMVRWFFTTDHPWILKNIYANFQIVSLIFAGFLFFLGENNEQFLLKETTLGFFSPK